MAGKAALTVTPTAVSHIQTLLESREVPGWVRLSVKTRGCSGLAYALEYVDNPVVGDEEIIPEEGVRLCIDPGALLFLIGSEMDYKETPLESGFFFHNPNEKGKCGCGESFHV